ncbi:MAG: DUF342 domain-containing protein [Leptospirales bacterium]|nr:DUF342 domain-containing protein [Leptospirales bacterium]
MNESTEERGLPTAELLVDEDQMVARLRVHGYYHPMIDYQHLIGLLDGHGVVFGTDVSAVQRLVERFRTSRGNATVEEIVAQGIPPVPSQDGKLDILIQPPPPVTIQEDGHADFRNINRFQAVAGGAVLAKRTPPVQGKSGANIRGEEVKPAKPHEPALALGENVKFDSTTGEYTAVTHGVFVYENDKISVNPILTIEGNVGLASGNIDYDGNIRITGTIERGSRLEAAGDVEVLGLVESADLRIGGSLTVRNGINTRREGQLIIGGNLNAVYVENTRLAVDGHISIEKSLIGSDVWCLGDLYLQTRSSAISAGEIRTFGSIAADIIGNRSNIPTHLFIGTHHKNQKYFDMTAEELEPAEREFYKRSEEIQVIKAYVQRMKGKIPVDKQAAFRIKYREYKLAVEMKDRLQGLVQSLRESRYNHEEIRVIAREVILPGVVIHYRDHVEKITAPQTKCIMRFRPGMIKPTIEAFKG